MSLDTETQSSNASATTGASSSSPLSSASSSASSASTPPPRMTVPQPPQAGSIKPSAAAKPAPPPAPLTVYDHFIANDEDIVGQIAFAMYENERRDWLTSWRSQTGGDPSHEHYTAFISSNLTQGQRQRYRSAARAQLDNHYLNHYEGSSANGDFRQSRAQKEAEAAERRRRTRRGFLAVIASLFILGVIAAGVILALRYDMFGLFPAPVVR